MLQKAADQGVQLWLPTDCVIAEEFKGGIPTKTVSVDDIPEGCMRLDIGTETLAAFGNASGEANTIGWNGPMGVFEMD